jgi:DNA processing protein
VADTAPAGRDEVAAYLALGQIPGIGARRLTTLLRAFASAIGAMHAPHRAIERLPGFNSAAASAIRSVRPDAGLRILDDLDRLGAGVLVPLDPRYPPLLAEIPDPPTALYVWGQVELLSRPAVAMVGSRDHSSYGGAAARWLAGGVAPHLVVVSGMARGLDAMAHEAALDAGGASVGVLGNGFGVIYPAANGRLYQRMIKEGCLVTELQPGERPHAGAFPRRNRLIAGLAPLTVVIEAATNSGAIITADRALDQGRSVMAVPGPITSPRSLGCNRLIQQGAKPALCPEDVLEEFGIRPGRPARATREVDTGALTGVQRTLWEALAEPRHVDVLAAATNVDTSSVLTALTHMEMHGLVRQHAGMLFERA